MSADTIVPEPGDPQSLNRYAYVNNNPLKYTDPSGHFGFIGAVVGGAVGAVGGAVVSVGSQVVGSVVSGEPLSIDVGEVVNAAVAGGVGGALAGATGGASLIAQATVGAAGGVVGGQLGRAAQNVVKGQSVTSGLFNPYDMFIDTLFGALGGALNSLTSGASSSADDVPGWMRHILRGRRTEVKMLEKLGRIKNTTGVEGIVDDVLTTTIPDYLDDAAKVMGEIKDVAKLSGTKQIRAQLEYAGREGYKYILHVRKDTKVVQWLWDFADDNDWFEIVTDVVSATE